YFGFAPAVFVAATQNLWLGGAVLLFALILQLFEGNFLVPKVMSHAIGLSPLTTILAMLSGAALLGLPGAVLAVPVAGTIQVLVEDWIEHKRLAEQGRIQKIILSAKKEEIPVSSPPVEFTSSDH